MSWPLHVYLDEDDVPRLGAWAHERRWPTPWAIRALTRRPAEDPLLELSGDIDGLPADLSANFQLYLHETFVAEPQAPHRARRRCSGTTARR